MKLIANSDPWVSVYKYVYLILGCLEVPQSISRKHMAIVISASRMISKKNWLFLHDPRGGYGCCGVFTVCCWRISSDLVVITYRCVVAFL